MLTGTGVMCDVNFTVTGTTATATSGQTCVVTAPVTVGGVAMNIAVNINISTWTLNVSGDTLTMAMTGTASAEGGLLTCSPTASGSATRPPSGGERVDGAALRGGCGNPLRVPTVVTNNLDLGAQDGAEEGRAALLRQRREVTQELVQRAGVGLVEQDGESLIGDGADHPS